MCKIYYQPWNTATPAFKVQSNATLQHQRGICGRSMRQLFSGIKTYIDS